MGPRLTLGSDMWALLVSLEKESLLSHRGMGEELLSGTLDVGLVFEDGQKGAGMVGWMPIQSTLYYQVD